MVTALTLFQILTFPQIVEADSLGNQTDNYEYGIVMDGGSSGTRLKVFRWKHVTSAFVKSALDVELIENIKIEPGISEYAARLDDLPKYLFELTNKAEETVPKDKQWRTPIYFMATAGMLLF